MSSTGAQDNGIHRESLTAPAAIPKTPNKAPRASPNAGVEGPLTRAGRPGNAKRAAAGAMAGRLTRAASLAG